jgi:hypothetical protein
VAIGRKCPDCKMEVFIADGEAFCEDCLNKHAVREEYTEKLRDLISHAGTQDKWAHYAGQGAVHLAALIDALKWAKDEAVYLKGHEHEWNGSDYCTICGLDGRA